MDAGSGRKAFDNHHSYYLTGKRGKGERWSLLLLVLLSSILFVAGCVLSYQISLLQHNADISRKRDQVALKMDHIRNEISRELYANINLTQGLVDLVRIQGGIRQPQFLSLARELISHSKLIRNIALAPSNVIRYIYPVVGNEKSMGLDYSKIPDQFIAVKRAIEEKKMVIAGPVNLVQGGVGIIGRLPIFLPDQSGDENKQRYWGIAAAVIDFKLLMQVAGLDPVKHDLDIGLRGIDGTGAEGKVFWGDEKIFSTNPVIMDIALPSGSWQMAAEPRGGWPPFRPFATWSFLAGIFLSLVFSLLLFQTLFVSRGRAFEIKKRQLTEDALRQKNRALHLFSLCNNAVVYATNENTLLSEICRIAVESAGYLLAWVGRAENDPLKSVVPITFAGSGEGFLDKIKVSWEDNEYGRDVAGTAIRTRKPSICRDLINSPDYMVWRNALLTRHYTSAMAIPLIVDGSVFGALLIYAAENDAFDSTEVGLLDELGMTISHGIMAIRSKEDRNKAVAALEQERNELEGRVALRTRELLSAKEMAESADRLKSAFLATMSHELRTPLNSIIGFTGIILQGMTGPLNEEQKKQLGMVYNSSEHLLALINDVLDISKIEAGQLQLVNEVFDPRDVVKKAVSTIRPLAEKKHLNLEVEIAPEVKTIFGDQRRVEQILINLLGNAVKFSEKGVIGVSCSLKTKQVLFQVKDNGIGIDEKNREEIFKPFRQVDSGLTRQYEGTGLGLSICKKLVDKMGGAIWLESEPGKGSIFSFTLLAERSIP